MSRIYTVSFSGTLTNAGGDADLFELLPADDKPIKLVQIDLGQISEVGDTAEEGLRISVIRLPATVTSGSGGSSATPIPMDSADAAAGFAAEVNNTTVATTSSSAVTLGEYGWNIRGPFCQSYPDPAMRPKAKQGEGLVIRCQTTAADDLTIQGTATVEEE